MVSRRPRCVTRILRRRVPGERHFWTSPTLDELAKAQNVGPLDVRAIFGKWPGDADDGFEADVDELRHPGSEKDVRK